MPIQIARNSLRWHILLLVAAVIIFILLIVPANLFIFPSQQELSNKYESILFQNYFPKFIDSKDEPNHALMYALESGKVALFGSSELTHGESPFIPYNFFPKNLGVDLYAFGHAGFQARAIETELLSALSQNAIDHGKIVILISPSWFVEGNGTNESLWKNEVATVTVVSRIRKNKFVEEIYKQKLLTEQKNVATGLLDQLVTKLIDTYFLWSIDLKKSETQSVVDYKWNEWRNESQKLEIGKSTNEFGINDDYFKKYITPMLGTSKFPLKLNKPPAIVDNKEVQDFEILLQILSKFKFKPIFVMLPLNKKAYSNTSELNPTLSYVADKIKTGGFRYFDMWSQPYVPGVMTDAMHIGEYGWMLINEFIYQNVKK